ncbi:MAG: cbb3-type cytochrome c oxidase subunit 3 [Steroidobacteraceae bacterium]|nr:cbb3-type cytochrome c oxidase subunit 3 [Steroidobacteraceae bacterium]
MDTVNFIAFVLVPIALLGGAVFWAFGRKRKKHFEQDARIPFRE